MDTLINQKQAKIAYFSMEIGLHEDMPTYCGGLGILAGDTLKSCADFSVPIVGVTLINEKGFFKQNFDSEGNQIEEEVNWNPGDYMDRLKQKITVTIEGREVSVGAWRYTIKGLRDYTVQIIFLDTNLPENTPEDRQICWHLYGGDRRYRLKQEAILGIGGVRMLKKLGYHIQKYHMNEGHSSLLALELLKEKLVNRNYDLQKIEDKIREKCIFTTHTPIPAGQDKFDYGLVNQILDGYLDFDLIKKYGGETNLNMTLLGFNLSKHINGVAKKHRDVSREMFPGYKVDAITNGVHPMTWTCTHLRELYDKYLPGWQEDAFLFRYVVGIPAGDIWQAHLKAKRDMISYVKDKTGIELSERVLTIGFARRMTEYKRPTLIFSDLERLKNLAKNSGKLQLVFSGKAHPEDYRGKEIIKEIRSKVGSLSNEITIVYLEDYNMEISKKLVSGVDLWLNTPHKPLEASGTSGMKATLNGVINFSILDGWWIEGHIENITGWSIGQSEIDAKSHERCIEDLYGKLSNIIHIYYNNQDLWIDIMEKAISLNGSFFNSHRMVHQYVVNAYFR